MFDIVPVGVIHSPLKHLKECPLQEKEDAPPARVEIYANLAPASRDIRQGDEIILLTWLHKADRTVLLTHPRNDDSNPLTGVFSTRSPDRPNPIGLHKVKVVKVIDEKYFEVASLEVLDQTPVIDIKIN